MTGQQRDQGLMDSIKKDLILIARTFQSVKDEYTQEQICSAVKEIDSKDKPLIHDCDSIKECDGIWLLWDY